MDEASKTDESPQAASNALDKLIRLARKNCNFDYIDPLTKYYLHSALPYSRLD